MQSRAGEDTDAAGRKGKVGLIWQVNEPLSFLSSCVPLLTFLPLFLYSPFFLCFSIHLSSSVFSIPVFLCFSIHLSSSVFSIHFSSSVSLLTFSLISLPLLPLFLSSSFPSLSSPSPASSPTAASLVILLSSVHLHPCHCWLPFPSA